MLTEHPHLLAGIQAVPPKLRTGVWGSSQAQVQCENRGSQKVGLELSYVLSVAVCP